MTAFLLIFFIVIFIAIVVGSFRRSQVAPLPWDRNFRVIGIHPDRRSTVYEGESVNLWVKPNSSQVWAYRQDNSVGSGLAAIFQDHRLLSMLGRTNDYRAKVSKITGNSISIDVRFENPELSQRQIEKERKEEEAQEKRNEDRRERREQKEDDRLRRWRETFDKPYTTKPSGVTKLRLERRHTPQIENLELTIQPEEEIAFTPPLYRFIHLRNKRSKSEYQISMTDGDAFRLLRAMKSGYKPEVFDMERDDFNTIYKVRFVDDEGDEVAQSEKEMKAIIFKPYRPTTGDIISAQLDHPDLESLRIGHRDQSEYILTEPLSQNVWIEDEEGRVECDLRIEEKKIIRMMRAIASGYRLDIEFKKREDGIAFFALTFEKE